MRLSIYERYGNAPPRRELVSDPVVMIGRDPECGIVLDDPAVSPQHARIVADRDAVVIEDMGSEAGTFADGIRIRGTMRVRRQAAIAIGKSVLVFDHAPVNAPESFEDDVTRPYATDDWEDQVTPSDVDTPIEQRFLLHVRDNPSDLDMRMVFADWLEERGAALKAEFLRLVLQSAPHADPVLVMRMRLLAPQVPRQWRAIVSRTPIDKCKMTFRCPKQWEALESTDDPAVRSCDACDRSVYFCIDLDEVRRRGEHGDCVAFCASLVREQALERYDHEEELLVGEVAWDEP